MSNPNDSTEFYDACLRFEALFWLPATVGDPSATPDRFNDFREWLPDNTDHPLYAALPELLQFSQQEDYPEMEELACALAERKRNGFIAQLATPVFQRAGEKGQTYSWGRYHTYWLYAETLDALSAAALAWANDRHQRDTGVSVEAVG